MGAVLTARASNSERLGRFLQSVRGRLWRRAALDTLRRALWLSGIAVVAFGVLHRMLVSVPSVVLLGTGLIIVVVAGWRIVRLRPSVSSAAAAADREFGGAALMTTALECQPGGRQASAGVADAVLGQAVAAADRWEAKLASSFRGSSGIAATVAIVPLFAGIVLLGMPGASDRDVGGEAMSDVRTASLGRKPADEEALALLRAPDPAMPIDDRPAPPAERAPEEGALRPVDPPDSARAEAAEPLAAPGQLPGAQASSPGDGDLPGTTPPGAPVADRDNPTGAVLDRRQLLALYRTGRQASSSSRDAGEFGGAVAPNADFRLGILPAAAPETGARRSALSAAQAEHAARYLQQMETINEQ